MYCLHPTEERLHVYDGTAVARLDRQLCGLCGELVYAPVGTGRAPLSEGQRPGRIQLTA